LRNLPPPLDCTKVAPRFLGLTGICVVRDAGIAPA